MPSNRSFAQRLAALEAQEVEHSRFADFTVALMRAYGTPEEIAAWEADGRPTVTRADLDIVLEQVYNHEEL